MFVFTTLEPYPRSFLRVMSIPTPLNTFSLPFHVSPCSFRTVLCWRSQSSSSLYKWKESVWGGNWTFWLLSVLKGSRNCIFAGGLFENLISVTELGKIRITLNWSLYRSLSWCQRCRCREDINLMLIIPDVCGGQDCSHRANRHI